MKLRIQGQGVRGMGPFGGFRLFNEKNLRCLEFAVYERLLGVRWSRSVELGVAKVAYLTEVVFGSSPF